MDRTRAAAQHSAGMSAEGLMLNLNDQIMQREEET